MFRLKNVSEVGSPRTGTLGAMRSMIPFLGWQVLVIGSPMIKSNQYADAFVASLINPI
jgi:uncharacterized protein (DUF2062 family)